MSRGYVKNADQDGCSVSKKCVDCPLARCVYEDAPDMWTWREKWWFVAAIYNETGDVLTAAAEAGYSVRNAHRIIQRIKAGDVAPLPMEEQPAEPRAPIYRARTPLPRLLLEAR